MFFFSENNSIHSTDSEKKAKASSQSPSIYLSERKENKNSVGSSQTVEYGSHSVKNNGC